MHSLKRANLFLDVVLNLCANEKYRYCLVLGSDRSPDSDFWDTRPLPQGVPPCSPVRCCAHDLADPRRERARPRCCVGINSARIPPPEPFPGLLPCLEVLWQLWCVSAMLASVWPRCMYYTYLWWNDIQPKYLFKNFPCRFVNIQFTVCEWSGPRLKLIL